MATSGTVGRTQIDAMSIIEHATRRCGVVSSVLTAENLQSARENLFLILSTLVTRGLNLWCVEQFTIGLTLGKSRYDFPLGTVDVLTMLLRSGVFQAASTVGVGNAVFNPTQATQVDTVLVRPAVAGDYELLLEYSQDNISWFEAGRKVCTFGADPIGVDTIISLPALYWRVSDLRDPTRSFSAAQFVTILSELPMSQLSRDDYTMLPNKTFGSRQPLQYWYDKQAGQPRIVVWPVPSTSQVSISVWVQRQVQDVGALSNTLEVPQRWLEAIIARLAPIICLELPAPIVPPGRYELLTARAELALSEAEDSEVDGAPIRFTPGIAPYTR